MEAPVSIPVKVAEGNFRGVAHETKGMAAVYKLPDGKNVLRFSAFETSHGPDVHIYLVAANDAKEAGFIDLGSTKGNIGDQNYGPACRRRLLEIPRRHRGVSASASTSPPHRWRSPKVEMLRKDFSLRSK